MVLAMQVYLKRLEYHESVQYFVTHSRRLNPCVIEK